MSQAITLIIGLGNPGPEYAETRHNAGAQLVQELSREFAAPLKAEKKLFGSITQINWGGDNVRLFVPSTYMNESGKAVLAVLGFYKITPSHVLIVHDDIDLPVGTVRLKQDGGHGGNNGLRDIINRLGTNKFPRLRIGIGHPGHKDQVTSYVLKKPGSADKNLIENAINDAIPVIPQLLQGDWQNAVQALHSS